jgi:phosphate transport system protein
MMADPATIPRAMSLILISRNLERVGDHATNIAEEVIYLVKGEDIRHQHSGGEKKKLGSP